MQTVQDEVETIHLYVVREHEKKPYTLLPLLGALLCLLGIAALTFYSAQHPYYEHQRLTVPAEFLPLKTFTAQTPIIPTGIKTYPATYAVGMLTLTNGSVLSEVLPAGVIFTGANGVEVQTIASAFIPSGSATGYGVTTVPAKALTAGRSGNIAALAINAVYGTALYVRNLASFHGGNDSYTKPLQLPKDRQAALLQARGILALKINGLHYPCNESYLQKAFVNTVTWRCQFLTYHVPSYMHVTGVKITDKNLLIDVWFVPRPIHIWVK
jgi:hypothetical protein